MLAHPHCFAYNKAVCCELNTLTVYYLPHENQCFEMDVYPFWADKAIAEIELSDAHAKVVFSKQRKVIMAVTDDDSFKNASLATYKMRCTDQHCFQKTFAVSSSKGEILMDNFREKNYKVFEMFDKHWALVTAGSMEHFNSCTVSWGSLGNIWGRAGQSRSIVTVYIHPARYTSEVLAQSDLFTVSFFPEEYRAALGYMGSHSGRDGDKARAAGLTPIAIGQGVTYQEANLTFLCKKLYLHQFTREDIAPDVQAYYASKPETYPDFHGGWQPHLLCIGEIIAADDRQLEGTRNSD